MAEKTIMAYFKSPEEAEKAAQALKVMGVNAMGIERIGKYPGDGIDEVTDPASGKVPSLASLTLHADPQDRNAAILLGSDVSASGMSDKGDEDLSGRDILLAAVVDESVHHEALRIVQEMGGMI